MLSHKRISVSDFCGKLEKLGYFVLTVFTSRTWLNPASVWKNYSCFSKLLVQKLLKIACFLDECLSLLELLFEAIPSSNFVQEALQKSGFVMKVENLICQTHEVMNELRIVLNLRTKTFHISNAGTESISHS